MRKKMLSALLCTAVAAGMLAGCGGGQEAGTKAAETKAEANAQGDAAAEKEIVTILRAVHKYKDSREQFERRTHKRLIDITKSTPKTVEALMALELPAGVDIEIKL